MNGAYVIIYFCLGMSTLLGVLFILMGLGSVIWSEQRRGWKRFQTIYGRWATRLQTPYEREYWRKKFVSWQITEKRDDESAVIQDVRRARGLILAPALISAGIAAILMSIAYPLVSILATTGNWLLISDNANQDFGMLLYLPILCGGGLGYMLGFWLARRQRQQRLTYGDLQRRNLSSYRFSLWRWGFILLTLCYCGAILLDAPAFKIITAFHIPRVGYVTDGNYWLLAGFPLSVLLTSLVGEFVMSHIARQPRLLVTADPKISRQADDMLRATFIEWIQYLMLFVIFGFLASTDLWAYFGVAIAHPLTTILLILATIIFLVLVVTTVMARGHLGGTISGWRTLQTTPRYQEMKVKQ